MTPPSQEHDYFVCPHCGAELQANARFCRACGASDESGWRDDDDDSWPSEGGYDGEEEFDYDEFIAREFPAHAATRTRIVTARWWVGAVVVLLCLALLLWSLSIR